jgi:hypothetical protein
VGGGRENKVKNTVVQNYYSLVVPEGPNDLLQRAVVKSKSYLMAMKKLESNYPHSAMRLLPMVCPQDITTSAQ